MPAATFITFPEQVS